jgi:hypothetical protein
MSWAPTVKKMVMTSTTISRVDDDAKSWILETSLVIVETSAPIFA